MLKKLQALWSDNRSYKKRLITAGAAVLGYCFTFLFFGPFEMIAFGGNSMAYGVQDVWLPLALTALVVWAAASPLLALLRGKIFNYAVSAVFIVTLMGYLQGAFFNTALGTLTGDGVDWHSMTDVIVGNLLIWILGFLVVACLHYFSRKLWRKALVLISLLLVIVQLTSTVVVAFTAPAGHESVKNHGLTTEGMYEYSAGNNIFVFVLDRMDFDYIQLILQKEPTFFDGLEGFIGYTNAISAYARTQPALNQLLTGSESAYGQSTEDFFKESWTEDGKDLLGGLKAKGYSVKLYTKLTYLFSDLDFARERVDNIAPNQTINPRAVLPKLLRLSAYRYTPMALKPFFWADTNYYNEDVFRAGDANAYQFDDTGYAPGFTTATAQRKQGSFKLYHFYGSHAPYTMNADGTASQEGTTVEAQTMGSFRNLMAAFDRMKELGIYEDATIIITADHGSAVSDAKPLQKATRIGLFYKPFGSSGTPLTWSSAPVCTDNIPATLAKAAGIEDLTPYGTPLDEVTEDAQVTRYYYKSVCPSGSYGENGYYKYAITDDAADFENWKIVEFIEGMPEENGFY